MDSPPLRYRDRNDAGRQLALRLRHLAGQRDVLVLALPRGGVPVGYEVAVELGVPLDIFLVRKLGVPGDEELAMGAIASGDVRVVNEEVVRLTGIDETMLATVAAEEQRELARRERLYRGDRPLLDVEGKTVVLVDDGLATGSTMRAACLALGQQNPARIIVAVPVAAVETCEELASDGGADEVICAMTPEPFQAVGLWYDDFAQTTDDEVQELLARGASGR